jgi:hypothetical protein
MLRQRDRWDFRLQPLVGVDQGGHGGGRLGLGACLSNWLDGWSEA